MIIFRLVYTVPIRFRRIGASITLANPFLFFLDKLKALLILGSVLVTYTQGHEGWYVIGTVSMIQYCYWRYYYGSEHFYRKSPK